MQLMTGGGNNVFRSTVLHIKRIMTSLIVNKNIAQYLVENSRFNVSEFLGENCFSNRQISSSSKVGNLKVTNWMLPTPNK